MYEGDTERRSGCYEESTALWRGTGDDRGLSVITQNLGIAHSGAGDHERAIELLEESVELARRAGDPAHVASALRSLGRARLAGGADGLAIVKEAWSCPGSCATGRASSSASRRSPPSASRRPAPC